MAGRPPTKTVWVRVVRNYTHNTHGSFVAGTEQEIFKVLYDYCEAKFTVPPFMLIDEPSEHSEPPEDTVLGEEPDGSAPSSDAGGPEAMSTHSAKSMRSPEDK